MDIAKALLIRGSDAILPDGSCPSECPSGGNAHRLKVRIMRLTWVELSGLEPLTSCMP